MRARFFASLRMTAGGRYAEMKTPLGLVAVSPPDLAIGDGGFEAFDGRFAHGRAV
jgi:hypothetical protein